MRVIEHRRMVCLLVTRFLDPLPRVIARLGLLALLALLCACSPRFLIVQGMADGLSGQGQAVEDDLQLAREAAAFHLKLSESVLHQTPGHLPLAESVAAGFTQYAYAFVAFDADRIEARDAKAAQKMRERAARLYRRAHRHAMAALAQRTPGFAQALASADASKWPRLADDEVGVAYWAAAAWGGAISLSKDDPDAVADLPLAIRLATLAWQKSPEHGDGALASLMGSFEAARPGGSVEQARIHFERAVAIGAGRNAGPYVAQAESLALPAGDRPAFEALLQQALKVSAGRRDLQNEVMRERATWLLSVADDLF